MDKIIGERLPSHRINKQFAFQSQQSGIEGGGLANQRRSLAEAQTSGQLGSAKMDFLNKLAQAQSPIGGAWQTLQTANAESAASIAGSTAGINSLTAPDAGIAAVTSPAPTIAPSGAYTTMGKPGGTPPGSPHGGQTYTGPGGVKWQYRINGPSGKGWYK